MAEKDIVGGRHTSRRRHPNSSAAYGPTGRALQGTLYSKESKRYDHPGDAGTMTTDGWVPLITCAEARERNLCTTAELAEIYKVDLSWFRSWLSQVRKVDDYQGVGRPRVIAVRYDEGDEEFRRGRLRYLYSVEYIDKIRPYLNRQNKLSLKESE